MRDPFDEVEDDEPRARDLVRLKQISPPRLGGASMLDRASAREGRRPAGNTARTWTRVAGEDPFLLPETAEITRKTTYVDDRFVRIDQADKDAARKAQGPVKPTSPAAWSSGDKPANQGESMLPPGFRNIPTASRATDTPKPNQGEAMLPPGFRNLPTASRAEPPKPNQGEAMLPPGFRDLPTASRAEPPKPNQGEAMIPPGFRNLPTAAKAADDMVAARPKGTPAAAQQDAEAPEPASKNIGEAMIPPGFRNVPFARPEPEWKPPKPPERPAPTPAPAPKVQNNSGRMVVGTGRQRTPLNAAAPRPAPPVVAPPPTVATPPQAAPPPKAAPAPQVTPKAPPPTVTPKLPPRPVEPARAVDPALPPPTVTPKTPPAARTGVLDGDEPGPSFPPPAASPGNRGTLDDLFASPFEGRARMSRRTPPAPVRTTSDTDAPGDVKKG